MGQELARARSALAEARARQQAERAQLFALIGGDPETLGGALLPPAAERGDPDLEQHPQLQMLAALEQSATLSARAARRAAWPEVSLGIGRKTLDEDDYSADGNAVALSVEIPLFDRGQGEAGRARGRVHEYVADHALTRTRLRAQRSALQTTLAAQRESARGLRQVMTRGEGSLGDLAESSYGAGELGVMELLDAWRTELETRLQYLDTARAARATLIQLQNLEGQ
jgi:cobalt-zinc-cadmium efflux system outer membrane protein